MAVMTYDEFQRHIGKAGLTLKEFASLLRMNRGSISNLSKRGRVPTHLAVIACLMGELAEQRIDFRGPLAKLDITPRKPRGAARPGRFGGDPQEPLPIPPPAQKPATARRRSRAAIRRKT